ncbi:MAG: class I SAM-dependent methyltransferase [Chloroflexota bacterium]
MLFNSPLHETKANRLIEQFNLKPNSSVLEIGCGDGEFLVRVAEKYKIDGLGIDANEQLIEKAQNKSNQRLKLSNLQFLTQDATTFSSERRVYDLIICIGSEFIFGGYEAALKKLKLLLTEDGLLLMGTIFWKQQPADEYLQLMGNKNPHFNHLSTVEKAVHQGFIPLYICRSNDDEWDDFESSFTQRNYLDALKSSSSDGRAKQIEDLFKWQSGYLKWGTNTMGFGYYLFRNL